MDLTIKLFLGFLIGSIMGGQLLRFIGGRESLAEHGSGNIGAANAARVYGKRFAVVVLFIDLLKGALAVRFLPGLDIPGVVMSAGDWLPFSVGMATILGHIFSPFAGFKGGKGVATTVGVLLLLMPLSLLPWLFIWLATIVLSGYAGLSSLLAAGSLPVFAVVYGTSLADRPMLGFALMVLAMTIFTHRPNIRKMQIGSESRFTRVMLFKPKD